MPIGQIWSQNVTEIRVARDIAMAGRQEAEFGAVYGAVQEAEDVQQAVMRIRDHYGVDHVTYHLAQTVSSSADAPYVKSTYPAEWLTHYLMKGYVRIDPVVLGAIERQLPFDWRELQPGEEAMEFMKDAVAHGLGGNGYTVPVRDKSYRKALFSLNSAMDGDMWTEFIEANAADLAELAQRLHRMAVAELYGEADAVPQLGMRELECLTWTAQGKDHKAIAIILGISEHTTRSYLKSARHKFDCGTISQAVAKAIKFRLINP